MLMWATGISYYEVALNLAAVISLNGSAINCPDKAQQYYHNEFVYLICRYRLTKH